MPDVSYWGSSKPVADIVKTNAYESELLLRNMTIGPHSAAGILLL
jgi:hypothetical protein